MPKDLETTIFRELTTGIVFVDADANILWLNPAAEDLLGVSLQRALGAALDGLAPGIEPLVALCERARHEQKSFGQTLNLPTPQRDGSEQEVSARVSLTSSPADNLLLIELFDITQRHQLDRESTLLAQHGVTRRMLRQLAHEIRNPLGGLRGAAQLLERELADPALHEFTQIIIGEADRLATLMNNLLGPGQQPNKQLINIHELLERVATIVESEWPAQTVQRDYDPSLPDLLADRNQLTQALLNLLRNSAQATDGKGRIILRTRVLTNQILSKQNFKLVALLEIEDNGPGVPQDIADTLFYPLVSGREDGTGLGLPLAQDLVNRHGGLIEYESEPGCTVFRVHLPILQSSVEAR
jgi:two-component system nitrogen regulation sensor histidine kinase GlnL